MKPHFPTDEPPARRRAAFGDEEAARILARFDLGTVRTTEPFERGSRRSPKLIVTADAGRFLLKRRQPEQAAPPRVAFAHAVMDHLRRHDLPVPRLMPDREGRTDVREGESSYELYEFMPGKRPRPTVPATVTAGRILARIHAAGRTFMPPSDPAVGTWHGVPEVGAALDALPDRLHERHRPPDQEHFARGCRFLRRAYEDAADRCTIAAAGPLTLNHGDLHPGNLLADDGHLSAVLDFDASRLEPRIMDVANAALQFSVDRPSPDPDDWPGVLAYERIRGIVQGYETVEGRLGPVERTALPWLMTQALIVESVAPITRDGCFGSFGAGPFLRMVERKVRWLRARSEQLLVYLDERDG